MSVIKQIHEAVLRHKMLTGDDPSTLYLGSMLALELKNTMRDHVRFSSPINPQNQSMAGEFEGMKLLTVIEEPRHLRVF